LRRFRASDKLRAFNMSIRDGRKLAELLKARGQCQAAVGG
jgi:hypothetical protein